MARRGVLQMGTFVWGAWWSKIVVARVAWELTQDDGRLMFSLDISARTGRAFAGYLRKHLPRARGMLRASLEEMSVALVGNRRMAALHVQFMGIAGPTDVLTFELDHDERGRVVAGEVVVCVPHAVAEAKRRGVEARKEVLLYALHGMLHLCGFDDRTDRDFAIMHRREDDILKKLGVGVVFARDAKRSGKPLARRNTGETPVPPEIHPGSELVKHLTRGNRRSTSSQILRSSKLPQDDGLRTSGSRKKASKTTGKRVRLPVPPKLDALRGRGGERR